jgi:hypothetical protein
MKKLYFLNEEESKRILNLHKEATKKQYLSEQEVDEADMGSVASNAASGAMIGSSLGVGVFSVPGAIIGGAVGAIYGLLKNSNSSEGVKKILQACSDTKLVGPASQTREKLNGIADRINAAIEGMGTDEITIKANLQTITTIPDLCAMAKIYQTRHGEDLFDALDGDIDDQSEWKRYVYLPLLDAYENSKELGEKAVAAAAAGATSGATSGNTKGNTTNVVNKGVVSNLQPKTKTIQSTLGVPQTGMMDQATIDALMVKLNGSGTATRTAT